MVFFDNLLYQIQSCRSARYRMRRLPSIVAVLVVLGLVSSAPENSENATTKSPEFNSVSEEEASATSFTTVKVEDEEIIANLTCDSPPILEGTIPPRLRGQQRAIGTEVTYQCDFGYVGRGSGGFRSICEFDQRTGIAKWTVPNVACRPRSCGNPGFVANADRIGDLFTFPHKVEFRCHLGFKLRGQAIRFCQASGEWSGKLPDCKEISCGRPTDPENGRVSYTSLEYGAELRYECNRGFMLKEHQPRSCGEDGTWSNNDPVCIEARCEVPVAPEHGTVQLLSDPKVDSIAAYACDGDRTLVGASLAKCLFTGQWTFPPPKCASSCSIPAVSDGAVGRFEIKIISRYRKEERFVELQTGAEVKHGETVDLFCNEDFIPDDDSHADSGEQRFSKGVACQDGNWSRKLQCKSASCLGDPPGIDHGHAVVRKRHNGFVIYYDCDTPNFVKGKPGHVECVYGTWTGYTPICVDGRCYSRDLNVTGLEIPVVEYILHSKRIPVSCTKGYKATSKWKNLSCAKGKWQIPENICVEEACSAAPPQIEHGWYYLVSNDSSSEVRYQCDPDFEMKRESTVQCRLGEWTGLPPSCLDPTVPSQTTTVASQPAPSKSENVASTDHGTTLEPVGTPSSSQLESCFCSYLHPDRNLITKVAEITLRYDDKIKKGETAWLTCRDPTKYQLWPNGLLSSGETKMTCSVCEAWEASSLPICVTLHPGASWIAWTDTLKLLPGGFIEVRPRQNITIPCHSLDVGYPVWFTPEYHNVIYTETKLGEHHRFNSLLIVSEIQPKHTGTYNCSARDSYGKVYKTTTVNLRVTGEIQCPALDHKGVFVISYSNGYLVGSSVQYTCRAIDQDISDSEKRTCLVTGDWSGGEPRCIKKEVTCPRIDRSGIFIIVYKVGTRKVNDTAQFSCKDTNKKIVGPKTRTCQPNGEWSEGNPVCEDITCPEFVHSDDLEVSYPKGNKPLSFARFRCRSPTATLEGASSSMCRYNGSWSNPQPLCKNDPCRDSPCQNGGTCIRNGTQPICRCEQTFSGDRCEKASGCLIGDLMENIPEHLNPVMEGISEELMPVGSVLPLFCELNLILVGGKKASCGTNGKWDIGKAECVIGCHFNAEGLSTQLMVDPTKEFYGFGEFAILSCPDGHQLTSDVERVMCIGSSWSNPIPDCQEVTDEDED